MPHHMHSTRYTILYHARSTRDTMPYHIQSTQYTILYHIQSTQYARYCNISDTGRRPCYVRSDHKYLSIYRWHPVRLRGNETQLHVFLGVHFDLYEGMGTNSVAKCIVSEDSVWSCSAWLSLISRSHVEGGVRDGECGWMEGDRARSPAWLPRQIVRYYYYYY